jgi:hypothetical protein
LVFPLSDAVAVVVSHVLISFSHIPVVTGAISFREILRRAGEFLLRHSVVPGGAEATVVVATMVAMMAMMVVMALIVVVLIEQIIEETSDEPSRKNWQQTEHSAFSIVARDARTGLMPTLGCLQTRRFSQKRNRSSVTWRTSGPLRLSCMPGRAVEAVECPDCNGAAPSRRACDGRHGLKMGFDLRFASTRDVPTGRVPSCRHRQPAKRPGQRAAGRT